MNATTHDHDAAHPLFARVWTAAMGRLQPRFMREQRRELVAGLSGLVVEVGAGSGTMFEFYESPVERVVAIEPEPYLRAAAQQAAAALTSAGPGARSGPGGAGSATAPSFEVIGGDAEHLPFEDGSVDAVVCSLVLCSVPDQAAALAEIARILKPGGELRYYEHVAEPDGTTSLRVQRALDRSGAWAKVGGGCRVARDTGAAIRAAGFTVERERVETVGPPLLVPVRRHLLGAARRG